MPTPRSSALLCTLLLSAGPLAASDNLIATGQFDQPSDVDVWAVTSEGGRGLISFEVWPDEGDCLDSGSALLVTDAPGALEVDYSVCGSGLLEDELYAYGLELFFPSGEGEGTLIWGATWFDGPDCTGANAGSVSIGPEVYTLGWLALEFRISTPPTAVSARLELKVSSLGSPEPLRLNIDRVFIQPAAEVFADDFEVGEICRWNENNN